MTAVSTRLLRTGSSAVVTAAGDFHQSAQGPNLYGHVVRAGTRVQWVVTEGRGGLVLAAGYAWTRSGAWTKASAAAHRPRVVIR